MNDVSETPDDVFEGVERAIDLLASGDAQAAAAEYRELAARAPDAPEVLVLEGMLAGREGAVDDALHAYQKAASNDPTYALPLVLAAEIHLDQGDVDRCLELCATASGAADTDDAKAEVLLVEASAWAEREKEGEVRKRIAALAALELTDPALCLSAGDLALEYEDLKRASTWYTQTTEIDPEAAHAWHGLGLVHEAGGNAGAMVSAWLKTLELDQASEPAPWHITRDEFEGEVEKAMASLPEVIREKLAGVAVLVEDWPTAELVKDGTDPRLLGLFSGTPTTDQGTLDGSPMEPDTIRLFQRNIESVVEGRDELLEEIRVTLIHETAHYFGLEDEDLEKMGLG